MKSIAHDCFERSKDLITSTMAGEEGGVGIGRGESLGRQVNGNLQRRYEQATDKLPRYSQGRYGHSL